MADTEHEQIQKGGRTKRGVFDGNDRVARVARWLRNPVKSERVTELVLECAVSDEAPMLLQRWARDDVHSEIAVEIDALIQDYADDKGTTCSASLQWRLEDGSVWLSKGFRGLCQDNSRENVRPLDGSQLSIITQLQRHNEAKDRTIIELFRQSEDRWGKMFELMDRALERSERRALMAEEQAEDANEERDQLAAVAERATATAEVAIEQAEQTKTDDKLGQVVELVSRQLMSGGT
jgi:hypothetical protein